MNMNDLFSLKGKVALVTGGVGLLGREHGKALSEAGAHVVVCDMDQTACESVAKELPGEHLGLRLNVNDKSSVETALSTVRKRFDGIDILINNAAVNDKFESPIAAAEQSKLENYPEALWRQMIDVNVTGVFLCSQVIGSDMARRGKGSIINIASTYGMVGPDQSIYQRPDGSQPFYKSAAYITSKGAVISMTRFLATYWGRQGVRVNSLSPGGVENCQDEYFVKNYSAKTPLGRMANPSDYKGAVLFLASEASSYMTGSNLVVDGGWTAW